MTKDRQNNDYSPFQGMKMKDLLQRRCNNLLVFRNKTVSLQHNVYKFRKAQTERNDKQLDPYSGGV